MVSIQRRLNSTGRKRLPRERIDIELKPPLDAFSFPVATATIDLNDLHIEPSARVVLEAYFRSSAMRFNCGTVASVSPPPRMILNDIDRGGALKFRLLIIAADETGRIIASAEGLNPRQTSTALDREPLLAVRETDLGEELWRLDVSGRDRPVLVVNSRVMGLAAKLRADPLTQGLILPQAFREILRHLPPEGVDEDDGDWGDGWRKFLQQLDITGPPETTDEDEAREEWIEDAVDRFCRLKRFVEVLRVKTKTDGLDDA